MGSQLHARLVEAIERLRAALLPAVLDPAGIYDAAAETHVRAAAFRLLVHAEFEAYVEGLAIGLFDAAASAWAEHGTPSRVLVGLLAFSGRLHARPPRSTLDPRAEVDVGEAVALAQRAWKDALGRSHGLKEEDVLRLFLPLGIGAAEIGSALLSALSSFGSTRGETAHTPVLAAETAVDPEREHQRAKLLASDLLRLDALVLRAHLELAALDAAMAQDDRAPARPSCRP